MDVDQFVLMAEKGVDGFQGFRMSKFL